MWRADNGFESVSVIICIMGFLLFRLSTNFQRVKCCVVAPPPPFLFFFLEGFVCLGGGGC